MTFLTAQRIGVSYGDVPILERVDLRVEEGALVTIVGASGCGKSTFLRILLGQERATSGTIAINGVPIAAEPDAGRGIVFQRYSVFPHLTVLGNLMLPAEFEGSRVLGRLFGRRRRAAREAAEAMMDKIGLDHARDRYPAQLSGGMQQRLAIGQALLKRPRVLLLDEPFGALDPGTRRDMQAMLIDLWRETGMTVFMVTHDIQEAFHLGTRLLVFDKIRHDPQFPAAYGATITYDIPLRGQHMSPDAGAFRLDAEPAVTNAGNPFLSRATSEETQP
ncbi:ATP-binding cassette domain-containing protein [Jiella sp. MQZ9-1]|uniref:ATP-binding cassette domain-containing protein n=1 Tax=Jiella flava TaxID=2816857 RepID=A0A939G0K5_9HYPH|nr:ATP-binding cassette domain-containing protein [Jiella flava]MBO0663581.1 ATP-binding cassette domain-containing protein [Jiella flava]MCD2472157.1 ATP-binding cassette domain-containing protein [Jiella flava]